jgi:hypothetical protein
MATTDGISDNTTHDLWIDARKFNLVLERASPTSLLLTITRPTSSVVVDGAVITLATSPVDSDRYPVDGTAYVASTMYGDTTASTIEDAQVVGFYSKILNQPFPTGTVSTDGTTTWTVTVNGTDANTIYYASVHAGTNILQYYPIGVQSYPLESSRIEKDSFTYSGSIPSLPSAPLNPVPGQVYYDKQLNIVQYYDGDMCIWIPTRADSIITGETDPGILGQVYLYTSQLLIFDGAAWTPVTSANFQVRVGGGWAPYGTIVMQVDFPTDKAVGDMFYSLTERRIFYWDGATWQIPTDSTTVFSYAGGMTPGFTVTFVQQNLELPTPYKGLLFYNTRRRQLMAFTGTKWIQANTDQQGTPTTDKVGIGSDGSYDERLRLIQILKSQLGWPARCVELQEEQFNIAIDNALDTYRQLSGGAYERRFFMYTFLRDQQTYYMNSPADFTDRIVIVQKIHRLNILGATTLSGENNIYFQTFLNQYYSSQHTDLLSIHLVHSLSQEFQKVFAGEFTFLWNEARRELYVTRRIPENEKVVIEAMVERPEQEIMLDRWCKQWIQGWAIAECKETLGLIRSKYSSGTPGAAGTITLNGDTLLSEARQDFTELRQQIFDFESGELMSVGNISFSWG